MDKTFRVSPKGSLLAAVSALAFASSPLVQAADFETDVSAFYRVSAYGVQNKNIDTSVPGVSDSDNGISHLFRIGLNLKDNDTGIAIYSSAELAGERWQGNRRDYGTQVAQFNETVRSDDVRLDYAYISLPISQHGKLNIGRQTTSYNNCLLVCDGRRDRVSLIQPLTPTLMGIVNYDRSSDTQSFNRIDNGDLIFFGVMGKVKNLDVGLLNFNWLHNYRGEVGTQPGAQPNNPANGLHALSGVHLISGYIGGNINEDVKLTTGFNYNNNGRVKHPADNGQFFNKRSVAAYVRAEADVEDFSLGLQWVGAMDGGLISPGFDTYSSLVNNNPDGQASPTSMYHMGGETGLRKADDHVIAMKVDYRATDQVTLRAGLGNLRIKRPDATGTKSDHSMFYDLQASYKPNPTLHVWATVGLLKKNKVGTLKGNPHLNHKAEPASTGANIFGTFADKDVIAGSLNATVRF